MNRKNLRVSTTALPRAMPGSQEKLSILADRARRGLPLWHEEDRRSYDEAGDA